MRDLLHSHKKHLFISCLCLIVISQFPRNSAAQAGMNAFTLPNGFKTFVRNRQTTNLVAIELWVRAGAREERREERGTAHFLEHLLFKGTNTRRLGETDAAIERLGGTLNAATGPDYARYYTSVAPEHLEAALEIIADTLRNASLPNSEVERERKVILDELAERDSQPNSLLVDRLYSKIFGIHPYAFPPGGTPEDIKGLRKPTLDAFYRRLYRPERSTLTLVGAISETPVKQIVERVFGGWQPKPLESVSHALPTLSIPTQPQHFEETAAIPTTLVGLGWLAPAGEEALMGIAAQIVVSLLGRSDVGGRLLTNELTGTSASARYTMRQDSSLLAITAALPSLGQLESANARQQRIESLERGLREAVRRLFLVPPSASEILAAKQRLLGRMLFEQETASGLAYSIAYAEIIGTPNPEQTRALLERITPTDVYRFLNKYLTSDKSITLVLKPIEQARGNGID